MSPSANSNVEQPPDVAELDGGRRALVEPAVIPPPAPARPRDDAEAAARARLRAATGHQPKASAGGQLVPEFKRLHVVSTTAGVARALPRKQWLDRDIVSPTFLFPRNAKILSASREVQGVEAGGSNFDIPDDDNDVVYVAVGEPWSPSEFAAKASGLRHPFNLAAALDLRLLRNVFDLLTMGPSGMARRREAALAYWERRARDLEASESRLHERMDGAVRSVLKGKRILLLKEMLAAVDYPDRHLASDAAAGFRITGTLSPTGVFPPRVRPATIELEELRRTARARQQQALRDVRASRHDRLNAAVEEGTADDVARGFLSPPLTLDQLESEVGPLWVPARRFAIVQGDKPRMIDDFSAYGTNAALTTCDKIAPLGVDEVAGLGKVIMDAVHGDEVRLELPDGNCWLGRLSPEFLHHDIRVVAKEYDLAHAYKQWAISPVDASLAVIVRWCEATQGPVFHRSYSLGFGAAAAVTAFNRVSRGGLSILTSIFHLLVTNYFDNYPNVTVDGDARNSELVIKRVFNLLGWALKPNDDTPYSPTFTTLGVSFQFERAFKLRHFKVDNKPGRVDAIRRQLEGLLGLGRASPGALRSLVGVLRYARSQLFGRCGALALQILTYQAERAHGVRNLSARCQWAMRWWLRYLDEAKPRLVRGASCTPPTLLFTDGACEGTGHQAVTIGAVIFSPRLPRPQFFGHRVPDDVVVQWGGGERAQTIGQAELAPVLLAQLTWRAILGGVQCIVFIDNDAARMSLIKGYSPSAASAGLLANIWIAGARAETTSWFERVASPANPADAPSRMESALNGIVGDVIDPAVPSAWEKLLCGAAWFDGRALDSTAFAVGDERDA